MSSENENMNLEEPAAIEAPASVEAPAAVEPAAANNAAYESIIEQQNEQIAALIEQNKNLSAQFSQLIANGAQIGQPVQQNAAPMQQLNTQSLADQSKYTLEDLAKDIGKRAKR